MGEVFIGRRDVLQKLNAQSARVLTMTGPPGVGKSALLRQHHTTLDHAYSIDFSTVTDVDACLSLLASALELPWQLKQDQDMDEVIVQFAQMWAADTRDVVLCGDHVERAQAVVQRVMRIILAHHDRLRCVFSSRRPVELPDEVCLALEPLDTHGHESDAVALFLLHAPQPYRTRLDTVEALVDALDGLPLAIELAAARARWVKPERFIAQLQQPTSKGFDVLHHAVAASVELLDKPLQRVFALCALASRFDIGMAAVMFGCTEDEALEHLSVLTTHSLLQHEQGWWFMLHGVSQFAQKTLQVMDDVSDARWRLAAHLGRLSQGAFLDCACCLLVPEIRELLPYRPALARAFEMASAEFLSEVSLPDDRVDIMLNVLLGLSCVLYLRGEIRTIAKHCGLIEARVEALSPAHQLKWSLAYAIWSSSNDTLETMFDRFDQLYHAQTWSDVWARAMLIFAPICARFAYKVEEGAAYADLIREQLLQPMSDIWRAHLVYTLAHHDLLCYKLDSVLDYCEEVRQITNAHGWDALFAKSLMARAMALKFLTRLDEGDQAFLESVEVYRRLRNVDAISHVLTLGTEFDVDEGRYASARHKIDQLIDIQNRYQLRWLKGYTDFLLGQVNYGQGQLSAARESFDVACAHFEIAGQVDLRAVARFYAIMVDVSRVPPEQTLEALLALHGSVEQASSQLLALLIGALAGVHVLCQRDEEGANWLAQMAPYREKQEMLAVLASVYDACMDWRVYKEAVASRHLTSSREIYQRILTTLHRIECPTADSAISHELGIRGGLDVFWAVVGSPDEVKRVALDLLDPTLASMSFDRKQRAFRAPGESTWFVFQSSGYPLVLLCLLVDRHCEDADAVITSETLCEALWPDEQDVELSVLTNRLYVIIQALKRDGLGEVIEHDNRLGGYRLTPTLTVEQGVDVV